MEAYIFWGIVITAVIVTWLYTVYTNYKRKQKIRKEIRESFGKLPAHNFDARDYHGISEYHLINPPIETPVDSITWADLDMIAIYEQINACQSSIGDEVLYRQLHQQTIEDRTSFEAAVNYINKNGEVRLKLQETCHTVGRISHNGLAGLLYEFDSFPQIPGKKIFLTTLFGIVSILLMIFYPDIGILAVTAATIFSMMLLLKTEAYLHGTLEALKIFSRAVFATREILKTPFPLSKEERQKAEEALTALKGTNLLISRLLDYTTMEGGSPSSLMTVLVAYLGLYAIAYEFMVKNFRKHPEEVRTIYETVGYFEVCVSIASYREYLPYYCIPEFTNENIVETVKLTHPLLKRPVANSCKLKKGVLITGSNASGKSTFSKTIAINMILGQSINTCLAHSFIFQRGTVASSMNLKDDVLLGDSFYVAEVKSLKRLLELSKNEDYSMLFIDEIFKGTSMPARIGAASAVLEELARQNCFLCLTTHDIELTELFTEIYENYHFQEIIQNGELIFDYKLKPGITTGSNAIAMLELCGYDSHIVSRASSMVDEYTKTGNWKIN